MNKIITILLLVTLLCTTAVAQTKLSLLDGTQYNVKQYTFFNDNGSSMEIKLEKKNGKIKTKFIDINDIWAVGDTIMYVPTQEGEFSVEDMRHVVIGKQFAKTEYNAWWACASGFAVGAGSMLYFYGYMRRPMIGLAVPIAYATGISFTRPTTKYIIKRHLEYQDNEYFVYGFKNKANKKIFTNTIIGTLSGLLVGGLVSMAIPAK
ncbi:MAG: hypothetical protein II394_09885 [Bacteroidales bacterium]|nr:hypothetical protein [Bacteroidales bacterium]